MVPIWGNIVVYMTSYFRVYDHSITLQNTFMVFPLTLCLGSIAMQLGSVMLDHFHPKVHLAIGGFIYVAGIALSAFMTNFYIFLLFYSLMAGIGYGIIYILPLKNAWLFFPEHKGMVGGIILSSHSFAAMGWTFLSTQLMNPQNQMPNLYINVGNSLEVLYGEDTDPARNMPYAINIISAMMAVLLILAVGLIFKKKTVTFDQQLNEELLTKGIVHDGGV